VSDLYVSATVDISDVEKGLDAASSASRQLGPAFKAIKKPMREDQRDHGKRQRGPFGSWARRSPRTLAFYRSHHKRVPRPLGRLSTAVAYKANSLGVTGESRAKWSDAQQSGGVVGRGVHLRARPFLWLSTKLLGIAEDIIERRILAAYGGGK
jgi:hypothetical protein